MANGDGGVYRVPVDPPPAVPVRRAVSLVLAFIAAVVGLLGYPVAAAVFAALSFVFNLWDFLASRGTIDVPKSAFDDAGRLKAMPGSTV
jgi:hypothetical protein